MHPSEHIRASKDDVLSGKRIVLGVTGSIAAVETVKMARELIRFGAEVFPVMSPAATRILHPDALWFSTGNRPVTETTGAVEHVSFCGEVPDRVDLLLIAPATANTISKIACGIDDTPVTTFATTAIGSGVPILVVPAMHSSMYKNPFVTENVQKLKDRGVMFVEPRWEEKKAKMPEVDVVVDHTIRAICGKWKKRVLVVTGSTVERLDDMRALTNMSTGAMGVALVREAFRAGADVEVWCGRSFKEVPSYVPVSCFESVSDLVGLVERAEKDRTDGAEKRWDVVFVPAAISDYTPERFEGKIPSGQDELVLTLRRTQKVLPLLRKFAGFLVGFKAESRVDPQTLVERAKKRMEEWGLDMVVANRLEDVGVDETRVFLVDRDGDVREVSGSKTRVAREILGEVKRRVQV